MRDELVKKYIAIYNKRNFALANFIAVMLFIPFFIVSLIYDVKLMIAASQQMGKMKFFPIVFNLYSDEMFEAIFMLVDFRKDIK